CMWKNLESIVGRSEFRSELQVGYDAVILLPVLATFEGVDPLDFN
ncbi:MAG: hypothetical protein AVDCRST_MAG93-2343, partial [uncultured Chloroflexia bacterium]